MRMEYIVMITAMSNKKLTKLVATRPSQENSPIFPSPTPHCVLLQWVFPLVIRSLSGGKYCIKIKNPNTI